MMKQQFCSATKPMSLQATVWLLANGSANSIPGEPGFWLDYIRISTKNPGTKHSGVFSFSATATRVGITQNYKCGRPGGWEASGENASGKSPEY
jgi:hypothetical protein